MWYLIVSIPDLCTLTYFDLNLHNVEDDTCIVLHVKHACKLIFQPIIVKCIYTDVPTILLFHTNNKEGVGCSKAAVLLLLIDCCSHCSVL